MRILTGIWTNEEVFFEEEYNIHSDMGNKRIKFYEHFKRMNPIG